MANIFLVSHNLPLFHSPKSSWNKLQNMRNSENISPILHSAPHDNNYILTQIISYIMIYMLELWQLISKDLMLDSSNEPIRITKRKINDVSIAYFNTLRCIVDWKHVLNKNSPDNEYNEFLIIFLGLYNEVFPKQKTKNRRQSFNSPLMTKGLRKSSKKKRRLYEQFLKNRNPEKELNYKQYKTQIIQILSIYTNIIQWNLWIADT